MDHVRRRVLNMSPEEVSAALEQISALGTGEQFDFRPVRNRAVELPAPPSTPQSLTVRVAVDHTTPLVWRRLVVRGDVTLDAFHEVIQRSLGWQGHHLHRFWAPTDEGRTRGAHFETEADLAEGEEGTPEAEVRLDQLLREPGDQVAYTYDFGDGWDHTVDLETTGPLDRDAPRARCLAGERAGPLEDSGGPPGHQELVEAFASDPALSSLREEVREWLPTGWDPGHLDLDQVNTALSLVGATADEIFATCAGGHPPPEALGPLLEIAPPDVVIEIAAMCRDAATTELDLDADDLAQLARPYRFLVDLAGADGIPLTSAGWMKPAVVEQIFTGLRIGERWIGKGNREDLTPPVAELRALAVDLALLRKHKGRLLRTQAAARRSTDREFVGLIAGALLRHRNPWVQSARALFALCTASRGRQAGEWADTVADLMTRSGLGTGAFGMDRWDVLDLVDPTKAVLHPSGTPCLPPHPREDQHAVALAVFALWPARLSELGAQ